MHLRPGCKRKEWGRRVCGGLSSTLGVARCGRSAGCVLCALWAVSAAVLGGVSCGGEHIIIEKQITHINTRQEHRHKGPHEEPPHSLNNDRRWRVNPIGPTCICGQGVKDQQVTHTHKPTENNTPETDTHTEGKNTTPNPQTNTSHKHLTTLEGGATTVRAT